MIPSPQTEASYATANRSRSHRRRAVPRAVKGSRPWRVTRRTQTRPRRQPEATSPARWQSPSTGRRRPCGRHRAHRCKRSSALRRRWWCTPPRSGPLLPADEADQVAGFVDLHLIDEGLELAAADVAPRPPGHPPRTSTAALATDHGATPVLVGRGAPSPKTGAVHDVTAHAIRAQARRCARTRNTVASFPAARRCAPARALQGGVPSGSARRHRYGRIEPALR